MLTRYHRLARETPAYAWWKLPVAGVVILIAWLLLTFALVLAASMVLAAGGGPTIDDWLNAAGDLDLDHLDFFALDMLSLVVLIPAVLLGVFAIGPRPIGYLSSVAGRIRWSWLAQTALISFAVFAVTLGSMLALTELIDPSDISAPSGLGRHTVVAIVLVLLLVPFQAAAEEYVFRGYLMQLVGSWSRFAVVPVVVTTPLFVAGHSYELWGLVDVGIFGLTAAILTIRTGGLEAGIAAHTANNVLLFLLDALGVVSATDDTQAGPLDLLPTIVSSVLLVVLVEWAARRRNLQRTRAPMPEPPGPPLPMWPPPPYAPIWHGPIWHAPPVQLDRGPAVERSREPLPARSRELHPDTPPYPGELPPGWGA